MLELAIRKAVAVILPAALILAAVLSSPRAEAGPKLRVITYNVALGVPMKLEGSLPTGFLKRRASIRRLLERHPLLRDFDVLGLQEVCEDRHQAHFEYFREILRAQGATPYSRFAAANPLSNKKCREGQMILSRYPIVDSGKFELPLLRPGGKVALWVDLLVPSGSGDEIVRVYNLHLDNRGKTLFAAKGRWKQMRAVLDHYREWRARYPHRPAIVLGDFNALSRLYDFWHRELAIRETMKVLSASITRRRPTHVSGHQIDWIFFDQLELKYSKVVYKLKSDHFPVMADFGPSDEAE